MILKKLLLISALAILVTSTFSSYSQSEDDFYPLSFKGRDYEFVHFKTNWDSAFSIALERGGYLITIESQEENDFTVKSLTNTIKSQYNIDLKAENETQVWIGSKGIPNFQTNKPTLFLWLWCYRNNYTIGHSSQEIYYTGPNDDDLRTFEGVYQNWGTNNFGFTYPTDYTQNFPDKVAITLDFIEKQGDVVARIGDWINTYADEEKYFIIDYGCVDRIVNSIDTLMCGIDSYTLGDSVITQPGFYKDTLTAYTECDSIVELTIDFVDFNNNITVKEDRITASEVNADSYQWYRCDLDMAIDGANTYSLDITESGSYRLEAEKAGCTVISECYDFCIPVTTSIDTVKCSNEPITINGEVYAERGFYTQKLSQVGFDCDSTLEIEIEDIYINTNIKKNGNQLFAVQTDAAYQWYNCDGDVMIEGADSQTFSLTESGDYKVEITKDGCIEYSECFEYTDAASIKDINESDMFTIDYKNGTIAINNTKKYAQIELLDLNAKTIFKSNELTQSIDISSLPSGIYFIKLQSNSKVEIFKFMVGG